MLLLLLRFSFPSVRKFVETKEKKATQAEKVRVAIYPWTCRKCKESYGAMSSNVPNHAWKEVYACLLSEVRTSTWETCLQQRVEEFNRALRTLKPTNTLQFRYELSTWGGKENLSSPPGRPCGLSLPSTARSRLPTPTVDTPQTDREILHQRRERRPSFFL